MNLCLNQGLLPALCIVAYVSTQDYLRRFAELQSDGSYAFSDARAGTLVGMFSIGALLGSFAAGPISNRLGRRLGIMLGVLIYYAGTAVQISAMDKWYQIVIGRLMTGCSIGIMSGMLAAITKERLNSFAKTFAI